MSASAPLTAFSGNRRRSSTVFVPSMIFDAYFGRTLNRMSRLVAASIKLSLANHAPLNQQIDASPRATLAQHNFRKPKVPVWHLNRTFRNNISS